MLKLLLASVLLATPALAQENPSAYEALRVVGTQLNREMMSRIISVTGVDGDPQPRRWKILVGDRRASGGVREITVEDNRIASQRVPNRSVTGSTEGNTINTARLNLDSTGAYSVASHTAETSHVTFALVSYTLRTDDRGNPVWIVTLEDRSRRPVGTIHIKANDGRVTRVEGMYRGRNMEQIEQDPEQVDTAEVDSEDDPEDNVVKRQIKRLYRKTKEDARRIFLKTKRSFKDFVARW
ncbi:MAG TPA: hypothetical protein VNP98_03765 [Chthoniobacterales bacterium]|nr:hypothetical protein [Chthoniobacterales bacterium]